MTKWLSRTTFGWLLIICGGFLAVGAIASAEERGWEASDIPLWWLAVTLPLASGLLLVSSSFLRNLQRRLKELEDEVLNAVQAHGGAITAAELARSTSFTLDSAEAALRHLSQRGHLIPTLTDEGLMVYSLGSAVPREQSAPSTDGRGNQRNGTTGGTIAFDLRRLAGLQRTVHAVTWVLLGALLAVSLFVTVAGSRIWPPTP